MIDKAVFGRKSGRDDLFRECPEEARENARQFAIKELLTAAALGTS
jgi:hypothetical protein